MALTAMSLLLITAPINDKLKSNPAPIGKVEDPDRKIRCKSEEMTGSLAARRRICHTVAEWRQITENAVDTAQTMVDRGTLQPSKGN